MCKFIEKWIKDVNDLVCVSWSSLVSEDFDDSALNTERIASKNA